MASAILHRGPDAEGLHLDPRGTCGLAFRRLAIIDLCSGAQPLSNEHGTIWLVFNGEIYNFRALREELTGFGHKFRTQSDSEVIVHAYEQWGTDCFARLEGMFAIAIWDAEQNQLVLARDRLGKKPLYTWRDGQRLYFASELKAILAAAPGSRTLNWGALHAYLLFQHVPVAESIYKNAGVVAPGHWQRYSAAPDIASRGLESKGYWEVPTQARFEGTKDQAARKLETLVTAAVQKRLISDVPLGAFLSGGIDSSIVVALMRKLGVSPLRTFSIGFEDPRYNEAPHARTVAAHFNTEHHERIVTAADALQLLNTLPQVYDEPFADSSAIPTLLLSQWTRRSVTVALTGDGGDECFGGYDRYRAAMLMQRFEQIVPAVLLKWTASAARGLAGASPKTALHRARRLLDSAGLPGSTRYVRWLSVFTPDQLATGYRQEILEQIGATSDAFDVVAAAYDSIAGDAARRAAYVDLNAYLPGDLLTKVDRASMAHSLECRSPFLDHALVEFALSLPTRWKIRGGRGKRILREWAASFLPVSILRRGKMGFGVPIGEWFRGPLLPRLRDALLAGDAICQHLFRPEWLAHLLDDHLQHRANHEHRLWALLMLDLWSRQWKPQL